MALAVANSWSSVTTAIAINQAVSGFAAGELAIVLGYGFESSTGNTFIITDDSGGANTYNKRAESTQDGTFRSSCVIYESVVLSAPTSIGIAFAGLPNTAYAIAVLRVTGATATPFDQAGATTSSADDPSAPSITTTSADEIIVVGLDHDGADTTFAAPTDFTMQQSLESNSEQCYACATRIVSATATYTPQWTTGAARDYGLVIASYVGSAAPPASGGPIAWVTA